MEKRLADYNISYTSLAHVGLLVFYFLAGVTLFNLLPNDNDQYVSADSVSYRKQALQVCDSPFEPIYKVMQEGDPVNLNWATVVSAGGVACYLDHEYFDVVVFAGNLFLLMLILFYYRNILTLLQVPWSASRVFFLIFATQTWLIASLTSLNKEVFSYLIVAVLALFYLRGSVALILLAGVLGGLVKVQFFVFSLMLIASIYGVGFWKQLLMIAALLTVVYQSFDLFIFDVDNYFSRYGYNIRTAEIAKHLNSLLDYPLTFLIVMPIRLVINLFSGFSPARLLSVDSWMAFSYQVNAILLSSTAFLALCIYIYNRNSLNMRLLEFSLLYGMLMCLLPFFQLRYFLPLLPLFLLMMMRPEELLKSSSGTASQMWRTVLSWAVSYVGAGRKQHDVWDSGRS